jgi:hypothetical protein
VGLDAPELDPRLSHRFLWRNALADQVRSVALHVEAQLRFHFTFELLPASDPPQP